VRSQVRVGGCSGPVRSRWVPGAHGAAENEVVEVHLRSKHVAQAPRAPRLRRRCVGPASCILQYPTPAQSPSSASPPEPLLSAAPSPPPCPRWCRCYSSSRSGALSLSSSVLLLSAWGP